jgi:hypothetical protein
MIDYGFKIYYSANIISYYFSRASLLGFIKKAINDGVGITFLYKMNRNAVHVRHIIPLFFFALNLLALAIGLIISIHILYLLAVLYFILAYTFSMKLLKKSISQFILIPILFYILHIFRGIGSAKGIFLK